MPTQIAVELHPRDGQITQTLISPLIASEAVQGCAATGAGQLAKNARRAGKVRERAALGELDGEQLTWYASTGELRAEVFCKSLVMQTMCGQSERQRQAMSAQRVGMHTQQRQRLGEHPAVDGIGRVALMMRGQKLRERLQRSVDVTDREQD